MFVPPICISTFDKMTQQCYFTCTRGDTDQASDNALGSAKHRRFLKEYDVKNEPCEQACSGANVGVKDGHGCIGAGHKRSSTIESRPTQPDEPNAG